MSSVFDNNSFLFGGNTVFVEELYQRYLQDPSSVDISWQDFFKSQESPSQKQYPSWGSHPQIVGTIDTDIKIPTKHAIKTEPIASDQITSTLRAHLLVEAYKERAHLLTNLDPLGLEKPKTKSELRLTPADFGITDITSQINPIFGASTIEQLIATLDKTYAGTIGMECAHVMELSEREWLHTQFQSRTAFTRDEKVSILQSLVDTEGLETYIHTKFPGAKRFSVEG